MRANKLGWYAHFPNPAPEPPVVITEETVTTVTTITHYADSDSETV